MKFRSVASIATFIGLAVGQTPAGFEPAVEVNLAVSFGSKAVDEPGASFTKEGMADLISSSNQPRRVEKMASK